MQYRSTEVRIQNLSVGTWIPPHLEKCWKPSDQQHAVTLGQSLELTLLISRNSHKLYSKLTFLNRLFSDSWNGLEMMPVVCRNCQFCRFYHRVFAGSWRGVMLLPSFPKMIMYTFLNYIMLGLSKIVWSPSILFQWEEEMIMGRDGVECFKIKPF